MMCQCQFIFGEKCAILVSDVDSGGGCAGLRARDIWEISGFFSQFCCKPKIDLKKNIAFKTLKIYT